MILSLKELHGKFILGYATPTQPVLKLCMTTFQLRRLSILTPNVTFLFFSEVLLNVTFSHICL